MAPSAMPTVVVLTFDDVEVGAPEPSSEPVSDDEFEFVSEVSELLGSAAPLPVPVVVPPVVPVLWDVPGMSGIDGSMRFISDVTLELSSSVYRRDVGVWMSASSVDTRSDGMYDMATVTM